MATNLRPVSRSRGRVQEGADRRREAGVPEEDVCARAQAQGSEKLQADSRPR